MNEIKTDEESPPVETQKTSRVPMYIWVLILLLVSYIFYSQHLSNAEKIGDAKAAADAPVVLRPGNRPSVTQTEPSTIRTNAEAGYREARENKLDCPIYKAPVVLPLPVLPKDKLLNAKTESEVILVLYDSIRDLQLYTEIHRQAIYDNYEAYLNACK